jgi:hypothetical protein
MKRPLISTMTWLICAQAAFGLGGVKESLVKDRTESAARPPTGSITVDLFPTSSAARTMQLLSGGLADSQIPADAGNKKSPILAAVLSGAVPGAGEFYSHSYLKSSAFFAAEVVSWILNLSYNRRGDRATGEFQTYADANWSVVRYAEYLNKNKGCDISINPDKNLTPWQRVSWAEINDCERKLGGFFSHTLPPHGDQQYYELIGKYPQYNPGWDDANPDAQISETEISGHFKSYSHMRGYANDLYSKASTALVVIVVNHILSAADAAWSATRYNSVHLETGMKMQRTPFGVETVPTATLSVRW